MLIGKTFLPVFQ